MLGKEKMVQNPIINRLCRWWRRWIFVAIFRFELIRRVELIKIRGNNEVTEEVEVILMDRLHLLSFYVLFISRQILRIPFPCAVHEV